MSRAPEQQRLSPGERANLVAYLDRELNEAETRAITTKLTQSVTARRELELGTPDGPATSQLLQRVTQTYRILFTRALKGVYVWVPDAETRAHLASSIE